MITVEKPKQFMKLTNQVPDPVLYMMLIKEEFEEFWDSDPDDSVHELKEMCDLIYVILGYAASKGYDIDWAFDLVHRNNLGRCITDGDVRRDADGKIIKNENYKPVNLEECLP
jgi:predicted HAD superfamily Cof-like phosphohydrolase